MNTRTGKVYATKEEALADGVPANKLVTLTGEAAKRAVETYAAKRKLTELRIDKKKLRKLRKRLRRM